MTELRELGSQQGLQDIFAALGDLARQEDRARRRLMRASGPVGSLGSLAPWGPIP